MFQIGARNMQNFNLLLEVGRTDKPVFIKRGLAASITELLRGESDLMLAGGVNASHGGHRCRRRTFSSPRPVASV
jgi:3-deoxy-7-phosphoheptulonate synthase